MGRTAQIARRARRRPEPAAFGGCAGHHGLAGTPEHGFGIVGSSPAGGSGWITILVARGYWSVGRHGTLVAPPKVICESHATSSEKIADWGLRAGGGGGWAVA